MSYVSLLKNVPGALSQPTGIAAIASLGIHGAIALIVPLMPVNSSQSSKIQTPKAVGLMELSAADQSRLPQPPNTSQVALQQPKLPLQQQLPSDSIGTPLTNYPPLTTQLSNQPVLPVIPDSSSKYNLSYLPTRESIEKMARENSQIGMSRFSASNKYIPYSSSISPSYTSSASPFVNNLDQRITETESLKINRLPELRANVEIPGEPLNNPSAEAIDIGSRMSAGISRPETGEFENNTIKMPQEGEKLAVAGISRRESPEIFQSQPESKVRSSEQVVAKLKSYNNVRQNTRQEYPNAKEKEVIRETISTDTPEMEGTVMGNLIVDTDGKVLDIKFPERTESVKLQSKVREFFGANPPQADKQSISSYPFQVTFRNNPNTPSAKKSPKLQAEPLVTPSAEELPKLENTKNPAAILPVNTIKPTPLPTQNSDSVVISTKSNQELVNILRQVKRERQKSQ